MLTGGNAIRTAFVICLLFWVQLFLSAEELRFSHIAQKEGLVNLSVSSIVQDSRGFLWFGTQGGLHRYNGHEFKVYQTEPFNQESLSHQLIQTLFIDSDDTIWIGTYGGLSLFDPITEKFTSFTNDPENPKSLSNDIVTAIYRDNKNRLWVGTLDGLNLKTEDYRQQPTDTNLFKRFDLGAIRAIHQDSEGRLWIGTYSGLLLIDEVHIDEDKNNEQELEFSFTYFTHEPDDSASIPTNYVMSITEDDNGVLWLGCWAGGLTRFNPNNKKARTYTLPHQNIYFVETVKDGRITIGTWGGGFIVFDPGTGEFSQSEHKVTQIDSLSHNVAYSFLEDDSGLWWIGTNGGGINRYNPRQQDAIFLSHRGAPLGTIGNGRVKVIYEDSLGHIWVGVEGSGLYRLRKHKLDFFPADADDPYTIGNNIVNAIFEDKSNNIWIGTNDGLYSYNRDDGSFTLFEHDPENPNTPADSIIYAINQCTAGYLWIGTYSAGITKMDPETGDFTQFRHDPQDPASISNNLIYTIDQDSQNNIWIGTNHGLNRYKPETKEFVRYRHDTDDYNSISNNSVRAFLEDSQKRIWIGTSAGGINLYDSETSAFTHYHRKHGLADNAVLSIIESPSGFIYVTSHSGFSIFDADLKTFRVIDEAYGISPVVFSTGACRLAGGDMLFGSIGHVFRISDDYHLPEPLPPPLYITNLEILHHPYETEKPVYMLDSIELQSRENSLSFEFIALDYLMPEKVQYQSKLIGFDADWIDNGNRGFTTYTNLPPGKYTFTVAARNSGGIWSTNNPRLHIHITPPFWNTLPFQIAVLVIGILLLWLFYYMKTGTIRKQNITLEKKVAERTKELALANDRLTEAGKNKDTLFSIISHDLRAPLSSSIPLLQSVLDKWDTMAPESIKNILFELKVSIYHLNVMMTNLLEWSKIQKDALSSTPEMLKAAHEIETICSFLYNTAEEKEIKLIQDTDPHLNVKADKRMLQSIIQNLLTNGLKFTPPGGSVTISTAKKGDWVRISVCDTGVGMSQERLDRLFKIDTVSTSKGTEGEHGSGLGLILCKEFAEKQGGSIYVESSPNKGTSFSIELPAG